MNTDELEIERLWNKEYVKVMICNFLTFFAFYLLTPLLPIYLDEQFHADKDMIGLVLSGYVVATLLIRPFSGFVVDSFNRKKVLTFCFFAFFIVFAGYVGAVTLLMFAIVRTMHGIPFGATTVANSTVAIDVLPSSRRNEGLGFYGLSNNIAMAIAPTAGIYIYSLTNDFALLFWISFFVALAGYLVSTQIKIPQREIIANRAKFSLDHFFLGRAWLLAVNIMLFGLCWGLLSNYVAIYGKEKLNITDGTGIFFMILAIALVIARVVGRKQLRANHLTQNCALGVVLSSIGYVLFAMSSVWGVWCYYASAMFIGLGNGQMYPAFLNMFVRMARHDQRGTANSSILISWDLGMGLGILVGGVVAEYIGFTEAFAVTAAIQILGTLLFVTVTAQFFTKRQLAEE
ncbi:MAG: MFS transporter [Pseudoflavonifractor sp.]|nr:MFS transporter [Pseudoflavonifractor sp.]